MNISFDFPFILTALVVLSGAIALIDVLFFAKKRQASNKKKPMIVDYARSFFPVLLLVWAIRSFIIQPYRVPTGSLEPTVVPGDFIAVSQFSYGLRLPVLNSKLLDIGEPKRGDIALFHWPPNPAYVFVKRVVGLPGDHIVYKDKTLYINGKEMQQTLIDSGFDVEPGESPQPVTLKMEDLMGIKHQIQLADDGSSAKPLDIVVPEGMYFMMGDNRDDSDDSRMWGFVPEKNLIGKAFGIWLSWDSLKHRVRWERIGKGL